MTEAVLREVGSSAREPARPRHHSTIENLLDRSVRGNVEVLPDRGPEILESRADRPRPQRLVIGEIAPGAPLTEIDEGSEPRRPAGVHRWSPEHLGSRHIHDNSLTEEPPARRVSGDG